MRVTYSGGIGRGQRIIGILFMAAPILGQHTTDILRSDWL
jgi:hypothetical protein